jgi:hypothetical protein
MGFFKILNACFKCKAISIYLKALVQFVPRRKFEFNSLSYTSSFYSGMNPRKKGDVVFQKSGVEKSINSF